jgi:hypothetical protein
MLIHVSLVMIVSSGFVVQTRFRGAYMMLRNGMGSAITGAVFYAGAVGRTNHPISGHSAVL